MNHKYTAYMSNEKRIKKLKDDNFKTNLTKCISVFFIMSFSWFGYSMYKIITELI